ncbi:hypothetical protein M413DRAFT_33031 [Hebeloma cylindrosporum]|uniref:Uncharacterized protein n=1 Tax=Hebeloma cylindrosporum TaxID=76867 RepID=A0A0C3BD76_HEBCY|nr:hypothetical protein M413DRAFT_33031 [Hebeloma cylindrosporum h7]
MDFEEPTTPVLSDEILTMFRILQFHIEEGPIACPNRKPRLSDVDWALGIQLCQT